MNAPNSAARPYNPDAAPLPPINTLLWRGFCKKCPRCGEGRLYKNMLTLHDRCPKCDLEYLPDQGDLLGPMLLIDRVVFLIPLVTVFCFMIPHASPALYVPIGSIMLILLVFTMPNRNGATVAFDYYLRVKRDRQAARENRTN